MLSFLQGFIRKILTVQQYHNSERGTVLNTGSMVQNRLFWSTAHVQDWCYSCGRDGNGWEIQDHLQLYKVNTETEFIRMETEREIMYLSTMKFAEFLDVDFFHHFYIRNDNCGFGSFIIPPNISVLLSIIVQHR